MGKYTASDGTEFDTSKKPQNKGKPASFAPNKVIQGWTIALQLMSEGDKWQLYVPSELAYGDTSRGKFITPVRPAQLIKHAALCSAVVAFLLAESWS